MPIYTLLTVFALLLLLANRLYQSGGVSEAMDYNLIATTVFTPTEYGAIGLSEEDAISKYGENNIEVYHSSFTPLEWSLSNGRAENSCYAKLICDKNDNERVVGLHYLGMFWIFNERSFTSE